MPPHSGISSQTPIDLVSPPHSPTPTQHGRHPTPKERWVSVLQGGITAKTSPSNSPSLSKASESVPPASYADGSQASPSASTKMQTMPAFDLVNLIAKTDPNLAEQMLRLGLGSTLYDPPEKRVRLTESMEQVQTVQTDLKPLAQQMQQIQGRAIFQNEANLQQHQRQQHQLHLQQQQQQQQKLFQMTNDNMSLSVIPPRHQILLQQQQQEQQQQVNMTLRSTSPTFDFSNYPLLLQQYPLLHCLQLQHSQQDLSKFQGHAIPPPNPTISNTNDLCLSLQQDKLVNYVKNLIANFPDKADTVIKLTIPLFQEFLLEISPAKLNAEWFDNIFQVIMDCLRRDGDNYQQTLPSVLRSNLVHLRDQIRKINMMQGENLSNQQLDNFYKHLNMTTLSVPEEPLQRLGEKQSSSISDTGTSDKEIPSATSSIEDEFLRKSDELAKKRNMMFQKYELLRQDPTMPLEKVNEELNKLNANNADYSRLVEESKKNMMHARANIAQASSSLVENASLLHYKRSPAHYHRKYNYQTQSIAQQLADKQ